MFVQLELMTTDFNLSECILNFVLFANCSLLESIDISNKMRLINEINNEIKKQIKGGPIRLKLTGVLAQIPRMCTQA